jgi:phosphodiesterase/alkaline phosphatase D-like protein
MRLSLARAAAAAAILLLSACGGSGGGGGGGNSFVDVPHDVAAGDVDRTSVVLWARSTGEGTTTFEVATDAAFTAIVATQVVPSPDPLIPAKAQITGLLPGTTYHYRATSGTTAYTPGRFRTPAAAGVHAGLRFGIGGDSRGDIAPFPSLVNVPDRDLDFFALLGDTIYADVPSPAVPLDQATTLVEFRTKHDEVYSPRFGLDGLGRLRESTAVFSTIDDHEVTDDFAGAAHPSTDPRFPATTEQFVNDTVLFENGLQAFEEWNPTAEEVWVGTGDDSMEGERNLYRYREFGADAAIFLLDSRSFRDEMLDNPDPFDPTAFRDAAFTPDRTMLGQAQLDALQADLLAAQAAGITWKFVMVPEPIQNLGPANPRDRFEGYAWERSLLLQFVEANAITNVVFLAADIHGTVVNNLQYQLDSADDPQVDVASWEITAPAIAYDPPLGQDAVEKATLTDLEREAYAAMDMDAKDAFFRAILDEALEAEGFDPTGLEGSAVPATLLEGEYVRAHAYGWVELEIDAATQVLTVTTWGIEPYDEDGANAAVDDVPFVLNRFTVTPVLPTP